jgi:hypothetical protein
MRRAAGTRAAFVALAVTLGAGGLASAQGKGGGGGGGGGNAGTAAGALYGDLYVIERDGAGEPVTRTVYYRELDENGVPTGTTLQATCNQPLAEGCGLLPLWAECDTALNTPPGGVLDLPECTFDPEAYDPCAVYDTFTDQLQEVKFGRESVSRAPSTVIDKSYAEALKGINSATDECGDLYGNAITLDPAGRITLCVASETLPVTYAWKTIDAPLENLGLYRAVMKDGCFANLTEETVGEEGVRVVVTTALDPTGMLYLDRAGLDHLICHSEMIPISLTEAQEQELCKVTPDPVGQGNSDACPWEFSTTPPATPGQNSDKADMLSAAVFIAAGADKTSPVTLDEVVNVNNYLGINPWTYTRVKKEQVLDITYFPFTENAGAAPGAWFKYGKGVDACKSPTFAELLAEDGGSFSIESVDVFGGTPNGVDLRGPNGVPVTVCRAGSPMTFTCDSLANPVYGENGTGILGCGGANWFAQAAEDARKTIWYLHNWSVPELAY